ncbi:TVP38/TMEM64 family protein [Butyrivibrio sp. XPD2002]|uniref:TVP38/TMEM64 family protein n=1 Tax=Butyrivibrio sp. XPD2002 TaxID=1280665 RepID=UPI000429EBFE|nr:VTT domain-containing protein [Butyrivibrio sp. XPD2002]
MENEKYVIRTVITISLITIFLLAVYFFIGRPMIEFVGDREGFQAYIESQGTRGIIVFGMFIFFQTLSSCIPGLPFYLASGAVLGGLEAALICDAFATLGNTVAFLLGRKFGRNFLCFLIPEERLVQIEELILDRNPILMHAMFMILPLPKDTYSWIGFYSKEKVMTWMIITFIARFPQIFLYTYGAEKVLENQYGYIIAGGIFATLVYLVLVLHIKKIRKEKDG